MAGYPYGGFSPTEASENLDKKDCLHCSEVPILILELKVSNGISLWQPKRTAAMRSIS